jgi:hypothetical protein
VSRPTVTDPCIFLSIYLHKDELSDCVGNKQTKVLHQADAFIEKHGLRPYGETPRPYRWASQIDLLRVANSSSFEILLQSLSESRETGTSYELLAYSYHDALILEIMVTKFKDWNDTFLRGWNELCETIRSLFDGVNIPASQSGVLGVSTVYWAINETDMDIGVNEDQFRTIAQEAELSRAETDLGAPLWHCKRPIFPESTELSQDLWMLITARDAEAEVNARFHQYGFSGPSDFVIVALALHKIAYERTHFIRERENAQHKQKELDRRVTEIVDMQRRLGLELDQLRSHNAVHFQHTLAEAGAVLADYRQSIGLYVQFRRAVVVNQRNFLIHCVALISRGADEVARSIDQEAAAASFLAGSHHDEIVSPEASSYQGLCRQLDSEIDYSNALAEQHEATLRSARDRLQISGQRELGEMAHHLSVDSAAVVASVVALIATEMVLKPERNTGDQIERWSLALALVVGSFALTQVLSSGACGKHLERWSVAIAAGLFGVFLVHRYFSAAHLPFLQNVDLHHLHELAALLAAFFVGWFAHWFAHLLIQKHRERITGRKG